MADEVIDVRQDDNNPSAKRGFVFEHSEDFRTAYSNNVQVKLSIWDLVMDFGMVTDADEERVIVDNQIRVIMSPQHARSFSDVLVRQIARYEKLFGPIPRPASDGAEGDEDGGDDL